MSAAWHHLRTPFVVAGLALAAAAAGCGESGVGAGPEAQARFTPYGTIWCAEDTSAFESYEPGSGHFDEEMAYWATRVPGGFGGLFKSDGAVVFYLLDPDREAAAIEALQSLGRAFGLDEEDRSRFEARQGRWDFLQLYGCYQVASREAWAVEGVHSSGIDERRQRVTFGVVDEAAKREVERRLADAELPALLYHVAVSPPISVP
ncbi:MAG: hypothetical protein ACOC8B_08715 [Gemmatimonadota bacterium]